MFLQTGKLILKPRPTTWWQFTSITICRLLLCDASELIM